jgi:hypothetical protein
VNACVEASIGIPPDGYREAGAALLFASGECIVSTHNRFDFPAI